MAARRLLKVARGVGVSAAVALVALYADRWVALPAGGVVPGSFVTHSVMLILSLAIVWVFHRGRFSDFGFTRGTYRFRATILLWSLPTAVLSLPSVLAPQRADSMGVLNDMTELQVVLFVWIYASACEEVLTRGLLQTLISKAVGRPSAGARFSMPVVVSALFFGAMHLVLIGPMGPAAAVPIVLATFLGFVAGRYREATGSLIPAIVVHMLFNVGGMLPGWIVRWVVME